MKTSLVSLKTFVRNILGCGRLAAVLLALAAPTAQAHWPNTNATKWVQFPDSTYNGLDMWLSSSLTLADDFKCILMGPVTDIHVWTSWLNNVPDPNTVFALSIWSDVPAGTSTPSHPGTRLWTQLFGPGKYQVQLWLTNLTENFWNPDPPPGTAMGPDYAVYEYNFYPTNPFVQHGSLSAPQTYWLCVSVTGNTMPVGWKTSTNQWSDAAVFSHMTGTNVNGDWQPIKSPYFGTNLDLSFALTTAVVTNPPPPAETNSVKYSQLPCLTSVGDTNCANCICYELSSGPMYWMADDFLCTNAGPVTDIHLWGSWLNDQPDPSPAFSIFIFSDVPATPGVSGSFSQPGIPLWGDAFGPGQYAAQPVRYPDAEGFLDPVEGLLGMDYVLWQYDFYLTNTPLVQPFVQQGSPVAPTNYWLAVNVAPQFVTNLFGWKISTNHYGDAAVFTAGAGGWQIAHLPTGNGTGVLSCDLAFTLTTLTNQCPVPSITCTSVTVQCGSPVSPPFAYDNCCNSNLTPVLVSSNNIFGPCPWTNLLTWKATDCRGQTNLCTQVVTVVDTTPPAITCATNKTVTCGGDGAFGWPSASDVCCGTNVTITVASTVWTGFDPLIMTRTWKATDCCGNVNYCSQSVTLGETNLVKYLQPPDITANGMNVWASQGVVLADDFVCTNSGLVTDIHIWCSWLSDHVDPNASIWLGIYDDVPVSSTNGFSHPGNLKWQQWFLPGQYIQGRFTTGLEQFYDPTSFSPVGTDTNMFYYCFYPTNIFHQQGTATQPKMYWLAVYGQPTGSQRFGWKTSALQQYDAATWNAWPVPSTGGWTPIYGPSGTQPLDLAFKITTSTNQCPPPTLTCSNLTVECGSTVSPPSAWDNCCNTYATVTLLSAVTNGACPWIITETWKATDCLGQTNTCTRVVTVQDTTPPVITCATNMTVECGSAWTFTPPTASDACCGTNVSVTVASTSTNGTCPWVITRVWKATDCCSNFNTCTQTVTVVDTTPPTITCATNMTVECGSAWSFDPPSASDTCCGTNVTVNILSTVTNSPCPLTVTRTWIAIDCCTNSATCSQTVTVVNTNLPPADINTVKYVQWPKLIGGYDVYDKTIIFLADDFPCTNTGPITDIHIWCSYSADAVTNPPMWLGIWSDVPAAGTNISHPGQLLWQQFFATNQYQSYFWSCGAEQFYMPFGNFFYLPDSQVYYYVFYPTNAFVQQGTPRNPTNYWLSVYCTDFSFFGWKSSTNAYHDAAVWAFWPPSGANTWNAMSDPDFGGPLNMAFKITTGAIPPIITRIQVVNPNVTLWWTSVPGRTYRLLTTPNVETPLASWTSLGADTLATSDITSTTVPIGGSRQFYRIQLLPGSP